MKRISNLKLKKFICLFAYLLIFTFLAQKADAGPSSSSFELKDYGFGSGGIATSSSTNFMFQGVAGEIETASLSSTNFRLGPGLTYTLQPNVPSAPTFTNPSNYYNKLKIVIGTGGNSTDTTYAIAISTDSFVSNINYVQADNTLGSSIFFQNYTSWGGASGTTIIGLTPGVTYYARVGARRGTFQQGSFGQVASAATINPTLTFSLQTTNQSVPPFTVGIGAVNAGQVTTSWQKVTTTISTNANNGGIIYLNDTSGGLVSATAGNYKINSVAAQNDLSGLSEGYGARGVSVSGAPMELVSPYNGDGNTVGIVDSSKRVFADSTQTPVTNGSASFELQAKASTITPAATDYADIITVVATGSF
jgi:hypothetical protein